MHILTISQRGGNGAKGDKAKERKGHDEQCCQEVTNDQLTKRACLYYTPRSARAACIYPRTARVIGGLDSWDIFCNSDYKHFLA
jgi:hypothetical protein